MCMRVCPLNVCVRSSRTCASLLRQQYITLMKVAVLEKGRTQTHTLTHTHTDTHLHLPPLLPCDAHILTQMGV